MSTSTQQPAHTEQALPAPKNNKPKHSVIGTNWLLACGILGFAIGCYLIFRPQSCFHDYEFQPRDIVLALLSKEKEKALGKIINKRDMLGACDTVNRLSAPKKRKNPCLADSSRLTPVKKSNLVKNEPCKADSCRQSLVIRYNQIKDEIRRVTYMTDTAFKNRFFTSNLFLEDKDAVFKIYNDVKINLPKSLRCTYIRDSSKREFNLTTSSDYPFKDNSYSRKAYEFFSKYPNFGTWALIMIFQIAACFLIIPISVITILELKNQMKEDPQAVHTNPLSDFIITLLTVFLFVIILYISINRDSLVNNEFFMRGYFTVSKIYEYLSYSTAIACLTGFLYCARMLQQILKNIRSRVKEHHDLAKEKINLKNQAHLTAAVSTAKIVELEGEIDNSNDEMAKYKIQFQKLKNHFAIFFGTSALLLSMYVLQTGALLSAINSLDLVQFLNAPPAKIILRSDFIYLIGGIYSFLLLIFYLPVKVNMVRLKYEIPDLDISESGNLNSLSSFTSGLRVFSGVIVASSPFLLSIIQYLFEVLGHK